MLEKTVTSTPVTDLITEAASFIAAINSNVFPGIATVMRASLIMIFLRIRGIAVDVVGSPKFRFSWIEGVSG